MPPQGQADAVRGPTAAEADRGQRQPAPKAVQTARAPRSARRSPQASQAAKEGPEQHKRRTRPAAPLLRDSSPDRSSRRAVRETPAEAKGLSGRGKPSEQARRSSQRGQRARAPGPEASAPAKIATGRASADQKPARDLRRPRIYQIMVTSVDSSERPEHGKKYIGFAWRSLHQLH